jgi:hypothetical protein
MHDRFEKEVQQKMEELQLTPSAPVWEKIELEIRPEKKRRRVFLWLFFGLLLTGGGWMGYQFLNNSQPAQNDLATQTSIEKDTDPVEKPAVVSTPSETIILQQNIPTDSGQINLLHGSKQKTGLATGEVKTTNYVARQGSTADKLIGARTKTKTQKPVQSSSFHSVEKIENTTGLPQATSAPMPEAAEKNKTNQEKIEKPSVSDTVVRQPQQNVETPKVTDSSVKRKVASTEKWKRKITVGAGISGSAEVFSASSVRVAATAQSSPSVNAPVVYKPAETKNGFSFMTGVSLSKQLNDHFEISFGLQYAYYSTRTNVGNGRTNDTTVRYASNNYVADQYYANNGSLGYTNQFHVVELPVSISYQPSAKAPVYLSVGAAYGRLIATNALTFSNQSNIYFRSNDNFVRNMLPVFGAVQVEFFGKGKRPLRLGPLVQYNLLKLRKENPYEKSHLFFAGIRSSINF